MIAGSTARGAAVVLAFVLVCGAAALAFAQDSGTPGDVAVGLTLGVGAEHLPDDDGGDGATWQTLTLAPDLSFGKFSLGLAVKLRFRFNGGPTGSELDIRDEDWSPDATIPGRSFFDLFLPIVRYARYGADGEPLVIRLGSFDDATLGTGFVIGEYANTRLLPQRRLFGVDVDLDGAVFDLPVVGLESMVGNVPAADVMGARIWSRPLYGMALPVVSFLQVGATAAADFDPLRYDPDPTDGANVSALGVDVVVPIVASTAFSFATHGDLVFLGTSEGDSRSVGTMVGVSGRVVDIVRYGFQVRVTDDRFIPVYFDSNYDLLRPMKYRALRAAEQAAPSDAIGGLSHAGWAARIGTSLLEGRVELDLGISGPLTSERGALTSIPYAPLDGLQVQGRVGIRDVVIPGIAFDLNYEKRGIDSLTDLTAPQHMVIATGLSYQTGSTVISLSYSGHYDPAVGGLTGAPVIASWIKLF